jgi:stage III sporulation protein AE
LLIVAILGAQTFITAASDSLAIRGAKYAISGMIPVVGGTVSGVLGMLISGVKLLSGSIGAISVAVLLSFMGAPLIQLLFYRLCIGACVIITSFSGASFGERFFSSVKGAIDCLIAVLTSSLMIFILEIIILTVNLNNIV